MQRHTNIVFQEALTITLHFPMGEEAVTHMFVKKTSELKLSIAVYDVSPSGDLWTIWHHF